MVSIAIDLRDYCAWRWLLAVVALRKLSFQSCRAIKCLPVSRCRFVVFSESLSTSALQSQVLRYSILRSAQCKSAILLDISYFEFFKNIPSPGAIDESFRFHNAEDYTLDYTTGYYFTSQELHA